ncbi:hypothetical protein BKA61DRAFT_674986 [Leptodontidium sp. MPI-SDFR-AT-0119]|nr:hypothetical protein BKA61DRAFT_674986 [Leptodontidium sp. MPI-SDFR-AT-0119]
MHILSDSTFLKTFAAFNTIYLAALAGAAHGMYLFSIPIIKNNSSTLGMLRQFHQLITLGARYMQGSSRMQGVSLAALTYLLYRYPDLEIARRWKYFAAALVVGIQVAWYEVVFIFPTNDRLVEMEGELKRETGGGEEGKREGEKARDREMRGEVLRLLEQWRRWHVGRIIVPLVCTCLAVCGLIF